MSFKFHITFRNSTISTLKKFLLEENFDKYSTMYSILFKKYITVYPSDKEYKQDNLPGIYDDFKQLLLVDWNATETKRDNPSIYIYDLNTIIEYMLSIGIKLATPEDAYFFNDDDIDDDDIDDIYDDIDISYYYVITMSSDDDLYDEKEITDDYITMSSDDDEKKIQKSINNSYTDDYILHDEDDKSWDSIYDDDDDKSIYDDDKSRETRYLRGT